MNRPILFISILIACCGFAEIARAGHTREPVYAGSFYPADRDALIKQIQTFTDKARLTHISIPEGKSLKALIMPHAGYDYSGLTAAHVCHVLKGRHYDKIVLLGPDHRVGFSNCAVSDAGVWKTPLGVVKTHEDSKKLRDYPDMFRPVPGTENEHSLEVVLPFLQYYLKSFEIVPVGMGSGNIDAVANIIDTLLDSQSLLVASSDLSHYLKYSDAVKKDNETIQMVLHLDDEKLIYSDNSACGKLPILTIINLARRHGWQPVLLHYSNSGDATGNYDRVVGYAAIAFFGDTTMAKKTNSSKQLTKKQGQALVSLARQSIMKRFGRKVDGAEVDAVESALKDPCFQEKRATFVTLTLDDQLRGCIGSLTTSESLVDGVKRNAVNAAFQDPRFPPLSPEELDSVEIEVSILTEPQPLEYKDSNDLISKLKVNVDGVTIQKGSARATFLPQVWKQLPAPEEFLSHLCMKAGLLPDAWQATKLEVSTYQVQYFEEKK